MARDDADRRDEIGQEIGRWLAGPGFFAVHLGVFVCGATILTLVNIVRSPDDLWFWKPLVVWGALLVVHAGLTISGVARAEGESEERPGVRRSPRPERRLLAEGVPERLGTLAGRGWASGANYVSSGVRALGKLAGSLNWWPGGRTADARRPAGGAPAAGRAAEEVDAFASWAVATSAWETARRGEGSRNQGSSGWPTKDERDGLRFHQRERSDDGVSHAGSVTSRRGEISVESVTTGPERLWPRGADSGEESSPSSPTGRFQGTVNGEVARAGMASSGPTQHGWPGFEENSRWSATGAEGGDQRPLVADGRPVGSEQSAPRPSEALPAAISGAGRETMVDMRVSRRHAGTTDEDVVLAGPVPVDPNDPQWTWIEAAATAWLARRETDVEPTRLPATPERVATGTDGVGASHGS